MKLAELKMCTYCTFTHGWAISRWRQTDVIGLQKNMCVPEVGSLHSWAPSILVPNHIVTVYVVD